jgi:predicted acyltransferase
VSVRERLFETLYASWLPCTQASLLFAESVVFVFYLVADGMDRRGIYLKV